MTINFKYGFEHKGFKFGWHEKKLFRLPSSKNLRNYPLKELNKILINNKSIGYRVVRDKKTVEQLMELTEVISFKYTINGMQSKDCPF